MSDLLEAAALVVAEGGSMQEADFYDAAMTGEGEPAMLPWEASPWLPVYQEAARWIPGNAAVTDLGCGTGRFAAYLLEGTSFQGLVVGLDFSPAAVAEANRYVDDDSRALFRVEDLRLWRPAPIPGEVFVCLEVLEHLADDLRVIERVPAGHQFVFSVPSYLSASHVRCFGTLASVFERYHGLVAIRRWSLVDFGGGNVVHVCDSVRRGDGW